MYATLAAILLLAATALPKDAVIAHATGAMDGAGEPIGNVKVIFTDGHSEMWTKRGDCMLPRVSNAGLVGWMRVSTRDENNTPFYSTVRVCWPDGHYQDFGFDAGAPYLEDWNFAGDNKTLVMRSHWKHGPAHYTEYDLVTGKAIGRAQESSTDLPAWVQVVSGR